MRTFTLVGTLFALLVDPLTSPSVPEGDWLHYGISQGGMFAVCIVLIYLRQQDAKKQQTDNDKRHEDNLEKIQILTDIAARSAVASETSANAGRENATAIQRLAAAVERFAK